MFEQHDRTINATISRAPRKCTTIHHEDTYQVSPVSGIRGRGRFDVSASPSSNHKCDWCSSCCYIFVGNNPKGVDVNAAFALYHPIVGNIVWKLIPLRLGLYSLHRPGVTRVFTDPAFLFLAFVLGSVCSAAYMVSGGALYAPVVIHAVAVAV